MPFSSTMNWKSAGSSESLYRKSARVAVSPTLTEPKLTELGTPWPCANGSSFLAMRTTGPVAAAVSSTRGRLPPGVMKSSRSAVYVPAATGVYWIFTGRSFCGGMTKSVGLTVNTGSRSLSTRRTATVAGTTEWLRSTTSRSQSSPVEPTSSSPKSSRSSDAVTCGYLPIAERRMLSVGCGLIAFTPSPTSHTALDTKTDASSGCIDATMATEPPTATIPESGSKRNGSGTVHTNGAGTSPVFSM